MGSGVGSCTLGEFNGGQEKGEGVSDDNRIDPGEWETELLLLFLMGSSDFNSDLHISDNVLFSIMGIHWLSASLK